MSDPNISDSNANPIEAKAQDTTSPEPELTHVESPGIAPDHSNPTPADAIKGAPIGAEPVEVQVDPTHDSKSARSPQRAAPGTALVLAVSRAKADSAPQEAPKTAAKPRFGIGTLAASVAAAAAVGGMAGSLATAGIAYWATPQSAIPAYDQAFTEALGRIDHELSVLKASVDTATRASSLQVGKITERIDRVEKTQADSGTKLAKAADSLDRVERRLGASASDVTGSIGDPRAASSAAPESRRATLAPGPAATSAPIVDGWVLRNVYNGGAMIQGRVGVVEVFPGDSLPGLGRIESVKRQDGRWVVVTSRGLIVSR